MPNILIISAVFPPEPVVSANLSKDIALELSKNNEVTVLCPSPSRPLGFHFESLKKEEKYKIIRVNSFVCAESKLTGRFKESFSFGKHCAKYIRKNFKNIDCIYLNSWPLASQYLIIKKAKKYNIPCILHIQDIYPESLAGKLPGLLRSFFYHLLLPFDKFIIQNASKVLCISPNMISYLSEKRKSDKSKFELIRNWQDDERFLDFNPTILEKKSFIFMYVGSISASAGVELLIHSFHQCDLPESKLLIVGNGAEKQKCVETAQKLNNTNIEFYDIIPKNVPQMQSKADVLLLPLKKGISRTATPSKLTAYLFSAKPVIACVEPESDVAHILKEANCGFIVAPENIELLAIKMKEAHQLEKEKLKELGCNGKMYAKNNLSRKINLNKVVNSIKTALNGN